MIREAREEDINKIIELFNNEVNLTGNVFEYNKNNIIEYLTHDFLKLFVYELDNKIVGVINTEFWELSKCVYIAEVVVAKKYRRKGIATKLVNYVENIAGERAVYLIVDENAEAMHDLMDKKGYKKGRKYIHYAK